MADDGDNGGDRQPRQPKDVRGLLKFCMEATRGEDAPGASTFESMPEEVDFFTTKLILLKTILKRAQNCSAPSKV